MFLRRLELQGFKSFADKVNLDLTHGVTAVVGPNGSGKSNITDSIRWLLGEREARNLRGGKAEDLIFAGTKEKSRMGLAQASLYFDNSSGFFPVDYKEVSISRRVSRDGESQIFLNKSEVRLKDIIDFFARSRMGARCLAIVNQGESDVFINATPLERREMIEEILGLKEYQIKKAEANRRLKNTTINLDKAKALIDELAPHLRLLKRQVAKYEGREEIIGELRKLEDDYYGNKLKALHSSLNQALPKVLALDKEISREEAVIKKLEAELTKVKVSEPETNEKIAYVRSQRNGLLDQRFNLQKDLSRIEARLELVSNSDNVKEVNLIAAINEIKNIAESSLAEENINKLKAVVKSIILIINNLWQRKPSPVNELDENKKHLTERLGSVQKGLKDLESKETEFTGIIKDFNEKFREVFITFEEERNKLIKLKEERNNAFFERERVEIRMKDLSDQIAETGRKISEFEKWSGEPPSDEETVVKRMFRLRGEISSIGEIDPNIIKEHKETEKRYTFLTDQVEDLEHAMADLKNLIKELEYKIHHEFTSAVGRINEEFTRYIHLLFGGGRAKLVVDENTGKEEREEINNKENNNEELETGVYIDISLPRKRVKGLEVLSGGERALVSIAALFALISVSPPPFLVLDEIDAALDERNAKRFSELLREFAKKTQFIIVTHNRATMEAADVLYGVTMLPDGTSKILSLKLSQ
ncbi:MAG: hypothetical protein AUJ39_00210 [Parcubacteria group bacterium CG1_02_42_13]|nr:MAG: hypothetical protein AUJ39_00210 [Parcubacteria group bacterium CG1_02_42_13]